MAGRDCSLVRIVQRRDLGERKIFGKAFGGEVFCCATEDGEKSSTCRIGTAGAAIEVCRDTSPSESVLQQTNVLLRRADHNCHFVETDAALGFLQYAARDLDAFAAFARR